MSVRNPVVAGMFYPDDPENLKKQLHSLFSQVKIRKTYQGVISPHAGYVYSGLTAAYAIKSLKRSKRFIILGPNHTGFGSKFAVDPNTQWETPLGRCSIDTKLKTEIMRCELVDEDELSHHAEHSIEVQLPFLQYRFKRFTFLPLCVMAEGYSERFLSECDALAEVIAHILNKYTDTSIVASSDFSHYLPDEIARKKDDLAMQRIVRLDVEGFFQTLKRINASICGYAPITILMFVAKKLGMKKAELIHYSTSGEVTKDFDSVVSYAAVGFK